jgi:hypothetical protein
MVLSPTRHPGPYALPRCIAHWYRNVFSHVPSTKVREIAAVLKAIHASEDLVAVACGIRGKAATDSDGRRPPNPNEGGHPVDGVRRGALSAI